MIGPKNFKNPNFSYDGKNGKYYLDSYELIFRPDSERKKILLRIGKSFEIKNFLKSLGFQFNPIEKSWDFTLGESESQIIESLLGIFVDLQSSEIPFYIEDKSSMKLAKKAGVNIPEEEE